MPLETLNEGQTVSITKNYESTARGKINKLFVYQGMAWVVATELKLEILLLFQVLMN